PVDQLAEALEAPDEVDREAIRRTGSDADHLRQPGVAKRRHALPDILALEPGAVRVVKEEQIERVDAQPLEAPLACRPQVIAVLAGAAQPPVREPWESARPLALAGVEVVADRADEAVGAAIDPCQRPPQQLVGGSLPVDVGGDQGVDPLAGPQQSRQPIVVDRLAEAHEAPATPGADRDASGLHAAEGRGPSRTRCGGVCRALWGKPTRN